MSGEGRAIDSCNTRKLSERDKQNQLWGRENKQIPVNRDASPSNARPQHHSPAFAKNAQERPEEHGWGCGNASQELNANSEHEFFIIRFGIGIARASKDLSAASYDAASAFGIGRIPFHLLLSSTSDFSLGLASVCRARPVTSQPSFAAHRPQPTPTDNFLAAREISRQGPPSHNLPLITRTNSPSRPRYPFHQDAGRSYSISCECLLPLF